MTDDAPRSRFAPLNPDECVTKRSGYAWLEVGHELIDCEEGVTRLSRATHAGEF